MPNGSMPTARPSVSVAEGILSELAEIENRLRGEGRDFKRFWADLERWKRRAVEALSRIAPPEEVERFAALRATLGRWSAVDSDPVETAVTSHRSWLESLVSDMRRHPDAYGEAAARPAPHVIPVPQQASPPAPLSVPEKVTLYWLARNVPVHLWALLIVVLLTAFALGGFFPGFAKLVAALLHLKTG